MDIPSVLYCADAGLNYSGGTRRMTDGAGNFLNYEIWKQPGSAILFGDTASTGLGTCAGTHPAAGLTKSGVPLANPYVWVFDGRIPAGQAIPEGAYTDTVLFTIFY